MTDVIMSANHTAGFEEGASCTEAAEAAFASISGGKPEASPQGLTEACRLRWRQ